MGAVSGATHFIVIGSGVFGASTALRLVRSGHKVTVLDRSEDGYCAPDAASNDLNKIVRADYPARLYRELGKRAITRWRQDPVISQYYHEVGLLLRSGSCESESSSDKASALYVQNSLQGSKGSDELEQPAAGGSLPPMAHLLTTDDEIASIFPMAARPHLGDKMIVEERDGVRQHAYFNPRAGWAEAKLATRAVLDEAKRLGAEIVGHAQVESLIFENEQQSRVSGVRTVDGRQFALDDPSKGTVFVCAGSWSRDFVSVLLSQSETSHARDAIEIVRATAKPSAHCCVGLKPSQEIRDAHKGMPVVYTFTDGLYLFEPDADGIVKCAIHGVGFEYPLPTPGGAKGVPSAPYAFSPQTPDADVIQMPSDVTQSMLAKVAKIFPRLAEQPVVFSRVCWYSDSLDDNWIIDRLPGYENLIVAGGDSGHGFKFLPLLGDLIAARTGLKDFTPLTAEEDEMFSFKHHKALIGHPAVKADRTKI